MNKLDNAIVRSLKAVQFNLNSFQVNQQEPCFQGLIILNNDLNQKWLKKFVKKCCGIILADGGANRLYNSSQRDNKKIKLIIGDLDSINPQVQKFYEDRGTLVEKLQDQNYSDFQKAINKSIEFGWKSIVCLGACGNRFDHTLNNLSITTKFHNKQNHFNMVLFNKDNFMFFVKENIKHHIVISQKISKQGCGLIPFGKVNHIETKGFKWNLGNSQQFSTLQWGNFISSSNQIVDINLQLNASDNFFLICNLIQQH